MNQPQLQMIQSNTLVYNVQTRLLVFCFLILNFQMHLVFLNLIKKYIILPQKLHQTMVSMEEGAPIISLPTMGIMQHQTPTRNW